MPAAPPTLQRCTPRRPSYSNAPASSHGGVNSQFNLLTRGDPRADAELRRFLPHAYDLKAVADYEAGPGSVVPLERVEAAILTARRFVDVVAELLDEPPPGAGRAP